MNKKLKIKVCGMRDEENIRQLCQLPIDYVGFIFYPPSPRYIGNMSANVLKSVPSRIKKIGVFVNPIYHVVVSAVQQFGLDMVQLHGNESPEICSELKKEGVLVIKAFGASNLTSDLLSQYDNSCDFFLFDTPTLQHGGSGTKFDWSILSRLEIHLPFFLSGGIGVDDANEIRKFSHPQLFAVDVNSRFEKSPGFKDIDLLKTFIDQL